MPNSSIYIYNILFIILYLWVVNICASAYKVTNNKLFNFLQRLHVIFIIDAVFSFSFDLALRSAGKEVSGIISGGYFLIRLVIFFIAGCIYVRIMYWMLERKVNFLGYIPIIAGGLICLVRLLFFYDKSYSFVWQRTIEDASIVILSIFYFVYAAHREAEKNEYIEKYNKAAAFVLIFMSISCLEKYVFEHLSGKDMGIFGFLYSHMNIIGISEDLYSMILSVLIIWFAGKEQEKERQRQMSRLVQKKMNEYQAMLHEKEVEDEETQVVEFCKYYGMTERESEILRLALLGKKNQEIAEELYISVGTVKAHIYSIFKKLEIERRSQLMRMFIDYKGLKNDDL